MTVTATVTAAVKLMAPYFKFKLHFWPAEYTFSHSGGEQQRHWHPA